MIVRPAASLSEMIRAGEVIHDAFVREEIIYPRASGCFLHSQSVGHQAIMVVALDPCGRIVGTTGAILDGRRGLPLDEVFEPHLAEIRATYHRIAELGMIASCERLDSEVIDRMICLAWWWAAVMGADHIVTSCEPHHTRFYSRRYEVAQVGPTLRYPRFRDARVDLLTGSMGEALQTKRGGRMLERFKPMDDAFQLRYRGDVAIN